MTKIDYEKARKRTRAADHVRPDKTQWRKFTTRYEGRCKQCGGPILAGETCWVRQRGSGWDYLHLGHSTT